MKIETTIKPRRSGTVELKGASGRAYTFRADEFGRLVCDIDDEGDIAAALNLGDFLPADESDFEAAAALTAAQGAEEDGIDDGSQIGEVEDLDDDDPANMDAAPVEAPIAPVEPVKRGPGRPKKAG